MKQVALKGMYNFTGQTVIVTGGAMGIGYGIAKRFAEAGASIVIADIDDAAGRLKVRPFAKKGIFVRADVSDEADVKRLFEATVRKFGRLDVLVNNAGIFPVAMAGKMDVSLWDKVQNVNLRSVFLCSREALRVMKAGGNIVNIASIDALRPTQVGLSAYDASKHGMVGFTESFALEAAEKGIRVNAIAPGGVATEGVKAMMKQESAAGINMAKEIREFTKKIPLKRFGDPDDIAVPTLFLASDAARYITGATRVIDGGAMLV